MTIGDVARKESGKALLLSNEAIVRGALEADVKVVAFYPGSPVSEIMDTFELLLDDFDLKMEISINEKVALETVAGASMAGVRAFTAMKSVGMNVASDSMFSIAYTGVNAGCVCLIADDPYAHSSQSEQDGRYFGEAAYVPMMEPANPQEAKEMLKSAFEISEKYRTLVIVRTTTRVNHQRGIVELDPLNRTSFKKNRWNDVRGQYFTVGPVARMLKRKLLEKNTAIKREFENCPFNFIKDGDGRIGIITAGVCYSHTLEALRNLKIDLPILKIGTIYPLPEKMIVNFLRGLDRVIIIEELSPYLETRIAAISKYASPSVGIYGKKSGHFSEMLEYNVPIVEKVIATVMRMNPSIDYDAILERARKLKESLPERAPIFCPGCPHRGTFWALRQALTKLKLCDKDGNVKFVFNNDIGCYSMAFLPPNNFSDSMLAMGASLGISAGMNLVLEDKIIAMIGDSTMYHASLPGIVNLIHHNSNVTLFVLDNSVTAMTGQQFNPNSPYDAGGRAARKINMEKLFEALGADSVSVIDPYNTRDCIQPIADAIERDGFNVVISRRECALYGDRLKKRAGKRIVPSVNDPEICRNIYACVKEFYCPAIMVDESTGKMVILRDLCDGCLECRQVCPVDAPRRGE